MGRDRYTRQSLGTLQDRIKAARVLMVGAGGIGCELLKNLVLTGFGEVVVVDLDTIDLSNLNRQFLFRHIHIKKPKALVAKETAGKFNPHVKIEAHHANIKDKEFSLDWFRTFKVVFNALDNLDARRHVNKMCLAADVPLIESGTTGFNGQVQVIRKGKTECYDCNVKETPKTFPICTIRSTPSQPIHCIVWAKSYLLTEIFGTSEDEVPEFDHRKDADHATEIANLQRESQALKTIRASMDAPDFARQIFAKVFTEDIERLRGMSDMWRTRKAPEVLHYDAIKPSSTSVCSNMSMQDQIVWSLSENLAVFESSLSRLSSRLRNAQSQTPESESPPVITFDKDDEDTLDFVAAAANLRSIIFDIPSRSKFDIKQMAGNIIPAIATTNAMIAGLCVLQSFKVMRDRLDSARMIFLTNSESRILTPEPLRPPNPACPSCSVAHAQINIDPSRATLSHLVEDLLRGRLGYGEEMSVTTEAGILYDPDEDENLPRKLAELGVVAGSFITVKDEDDEKEEGERIDLVLTVIEGGLVTESDPSIRITPDCLPLPRMQRDTIANGAAPKETTTNTLPILGTKRKRPAVEDAENASEEATQLKEQPRKREKLSEGLTTAAPASSNGVIVLDDPADAPTSASESNGFGKGGGLGAIVIDDD